MATEGKRELRRRMLAARRALTPEYRLEASHKILDRLYDLPEFRQAGSIMAYCSMPDEVQLQELLELCLIKQKKVFLPKVVGKGIIKAVQLSAMTDLAPGKYGILTVTSDDLQEAEPGSIDFIVVPGVAFAPDGARLGMGAGYYDRFLSEQEPAARRVALAFDCQICGADIPMTEHDQRVEAIITERRLLQTTA